MRPLPIRIRLTAAFILVMALALGATGAFIHHRQAADVSESIDTELAARAQEISALLDSTGGRLESGRPNLTTRSDNIGQVIDARGRSFALSPAPAGLTLLTAGQLERARRGTVRVEATDPPGLDGPFRVYARPHSVAGQGFVVIVATSLAERDESLESLTHELLLGGIGALVIAALAGFAVASAALRPVEAMRARAATISDLRSADRLPEPRTEDEIGRLARTLNEMLERLERVLARERAFVDDASHELRTPLTILRTELELALSQPRSAADLETAIRSAAEETEHLVRLADDLLLLARADSGQPDAAEQTIDVAEVLEHASRRAAPRAAALGRLIQVGPVDAAMIRGDRAAVHRAVDNLVDNALRHGQGTVTVSDQSRAGQVRIQVADQGHELDDEFAPRAFERFARAPQARNRPGSGLGLAIVDAVARAHGGVAGMACDPAGPGTQAWITFPLLADGTERPAEAVTRRLGIDTGSA